MKCLSLFAGVGGFDRGLELSGHEIVGQVEINAFANKVLERRWPHTPRWTDVREWTSNGDEHIDLLCGGFPCQDLSVAGKRGGLKGERSGLFWEIVRIAERLRPTFLLLENVPGLLSSNQGKDISTVLDALYELGYIVEIDECDSQYFGLAQRRKRLFICGINAKVGLLGKTHISSAMRCSFLAQSLLDALESLSRQSPTVASDSDCSYYLAEHGLTRKMRCCEASLGKSAWLNWLSDLEGQLPLSAIEPKDSDSPQGVNGSAEEMDIASLLREAEFVGNISKSWKELWGDLSENPKASTISTWSKQTTDLKICICAEISLSILRHIVASKHSSPFCSNAISSALTAVLAATSSVERIAHDLFAPEAWRDRAWLFLEQAAIELDAIERCPTERSVEEVLFEPESSGRHLETSGEARPDVAACLRSRAASPGINPPGRGGEEDMNIVVAGTIKQRMRGCTDEVMDSLQVAATLNCSGQQGGFRTEPREHIVTHTLRGEGFDASEDGTGRGTPLCVTPWDSSTKRIHSTHGPIATLASSDGKGGQRTMNVDTQVGVRRLTPTECERLQGFPEIEKTVIIELCSGNQKRCASADLSSLKSPLLVGSVERMQSMENARYVNFDSVPRHLSDNRLALNDVHIFFGLDEVQIHSREKLRLSASLAVQKSTSLLPIGIEDFARLSAGLHSIVDQIIGSGGEELRLSERCLMALGNGDAHVKLYGEEITRLVKNVLDGSITLNSPMKSIISSRLNIENSELDLITSYCSVVAAISGFIPNKTLHASSLRIEITTRRGWTCLCADMPCTCPDGHRYQAMGNAVSVPVIEWIGKRLKQQERSL